MNLPDVNDTTVIVLYGPIGRQLLSAHVDYAIATVASERLVFEPAKSRALHWQTLLDYARDAVRSRAGSEQSRDLSTREGAEAASRNCERCDGNGLAVVWASWPDPSGKTPERTTAYCVCALGRLVEQRHRKHSPDLRRRMPDLTDVLAGRSFWRAEPMDATSFEEDMAQAEAWMRTGDPVLRCWGRLMLRKAGRAVPDGPEEASAPLLRLKLKH